MFPDTLIIQNELDSSVLENLMIYIGEESFYYKKGLEPEVALLLGEEPPLGSKWGSFDDPRYLEEDKKETEAATETEQDIAIDDNPASDEVSQEPVDDTSAQQITRHYEQDFQQSDIIPDNLLINLTDENIKEIKAIGEEANRKAHAIESPATGIFGAPPKPAEKHKSEKTESEDTIEPEEDINGTFPSNLIIDLEMPDNELSQIMDSIGEEAEPDAIIAFTPADGSFAPKKSEKESRHEHDEESDDEPEEEPSYMFPADLTISLDEIFSDESVLKSIGEESIELSEEPLDINMSPAQGYFGMDKPAGKKEDDHTSDEEEEEIELSNAFPDEIILNSEIAHPEFDELLNIMGEEASGVKEVDYSPAQGSLGPEGAGTVKSKRPRKIEEDIQIEIADPYPDEITMDLDYLSDSEAESFLLLIGEEAGENKEIDMSPAQGMFGMEKLVPAKSKRIREKDDEEDIELPSPYPENISFLADLSTDAIELLIKQMGQEGRPDEKEGSFDFKRTKTVSGKSRASLDRKSKYKLNDPYPADMLFDIDIPKKELFYLAVKMGEEKRK